MKTIFTFLFSLLSLVVFSQRIEGTLLDNEGKALSFATLQLLKSDSSLQKIEVSKEDGSFSFINLKEETYYLSVSFIGFQPYNKKVNLATESGNLGEITVERQTEQINEVTITAEKALITVDPDKTIYNVANDITATGDDGIELLRKAPGLQVDNDDNIILEGKTGVTIYVNGKQSYLQGEDLKAYLKTLRAEEIESIEIITQPSSKYDAAGSAGILNIVLKREKGLGTKGTISNNYTYGDFGRNSTSLSLNHRNKKYNLYGSFNNFVGKSAYFINLYRVQGANIFDAKTNSVNERSNQSLRLGGDYYLSNNSTVGVLLSGYLNDRESSSDSRTPIINRADNTIDSILSAPNTSKTDVENLNVNVNYSYKDTLGREFSIDLDMVNYDRYQQNNQPNVYTTPNEAVVLNENINYQETPIEIDIVSAKTDYEQKLGKKGKVSIGGKVSQVQTNNVFDFYQVNEGARNFDTTRSNTFDYTETIAAAYVNYKTSYKKWKFQGGVRAEQTFSKGELISAKQNDDKVVEREYLNWFPSGGITYKLNRSNSLAFLYSRRIQRPNYQNLNPFEFQIDELSFRKGNPFLIPQFTENFKLSNTYKYTLNTSISYSYVSDYFAQVTETQGERRNFINTRNVADQEVWNLSVSYPFTLKKWWKVYASTYAYHSSFTANNPDFVAISQTTYGFYAQSTFNLPKKVNAVVSGWYSSPSIWRGTYETKSIGALNLAFQRSWSGWTAKVSFNDILYTIPWRGETQFGNLYINGTGGSDSRNVRLFLSYTFGSKDVKGERKRKFSSEEEQGRIGN